VRCPSIEIHGQRELIRSTASTPGLNFPSKLTLNAYYKRQILPQGSTAELILQSSEHPRLDYIAREEKDGSSDGLLKDYIGVYDPATGKLQLVEVPKLTLRSTLRSEMDELREERDRIAAAKSSNTAKRHALASEFGSKKSKKAIANMTENAIARNKASDAGAGPKDETVSSAVLQGMSSTTNDMPTKEALAAAVDSSKPRPPANIAAEYPSDVYTIDAVIGKDLIGLIPVKDWVDASEAGEGVEVHSRFVARRILKLAKAKEFQKLKVLKFILLCMNFSNALRSRGKGAKTVPHKDQLMLAMGEDVPAPVVDAIRRKFASEYVYVADHDQREVTMLTNTLLTGITT
jgi:DNA-directed RNA polymerase I subunit RPA49